MRPILVCTCVVALIAGTGILVAFNAPAQIVSEQRAKQATLTHGDMMKFDLRAQRSELVAANMNLTTAQAGLFVPIYLDFDSELQNLWNERLKLVARYAAEYEMLTDDQADDLLTEMFRLDEDLLKIRKKYYREFKEALGAKTATRFIQIDRRLNSLLELQAAQSIPLVQ